MPTSYSMIRCLLSILILLTFINAIKIHSKHEHTYQTKNKIYWFKASPDGIERDVLGMDGDFPKTIRVTKGNNIQMQIENLIPNGLTDIHFHGIFQKGSLASDGVGGTTQCDPKYKNKYEYDFNSGHQSGTYFYHSNTGGQSLDGLKGAFIIDDPKDPYLRPFNYFLSSHYLKIFGSKDEKATVSKNLHYVDHSLIDGEPDSVIMLSEWHHKKSDDLLDKFISPNCNGNLPTPVSALINNVGDFKCKNPPNCESMYTTKIVAGKAKRIRIINGSTTAVFHFTIQDHKMHLIECDGVLLDGKTSLDVLRISAGQRYSVIIQADQEPKNFWIRAVMDKTIYPQGSVHPNWQPEVFGELRYVYPCGEYFHKSRPLNERYHALDELIKSSVNDGSKNIDMESLVPMKRFTPPPPKSPTKKIILNINQITSNDGTKYLGFNNIVYGMNVEQTVLGEILNYRSVEKVVKRKGLKFGYNPHFIKHGEVIDLIINNCNDSEIPLHLHGHNFYVVYQGHRNSKEFITDVKQQYKFKYDHHATKRDTVNVNANSSLVLRFIADNPGIWVFHAQNIWLLESGLMTTFIEDEYKIRKLFWKHKNEVTYCKSCDITKYDQHVGQKENLFYVVDGHKSEKTPQGGEKLVPVRIIEKPREAVREKVGADSKNEPQKFQDSFVSLDDMPEIKEIMNTVESMQTSEEEQAKPVIPDVNQLTGASAVENKQPAGADADVGVGVKASQENVSEPMQPNLVPNVPNYQMYLMYLMYSVQMYLAYKNLWE
jgi:iron transport multicopper oxidase